jgi:hypothetical protein
MDKLQFPTLAIQLATDEGLPYDMPDDWLETCLHIASMLNGKYQCGLNLVYGLVSGKHLDEMEKEVNE